MDGSVIDQLYVCWKEPTGHISENLKNKLFHAKNIVVTCSKNDKLSSSLVTYWHDQCLIPNLRARTLLLVDSLLHQICSGIFQEIEKLGIQRGDPANFLHRLKGTISESDETWGRGVVENFTLIIFVYKRY